MTTSVPSPELAFSDTASQPDEHQVSIPKTSAASQPTNSMKSTDLSDDSDGFQMGTPASVMSDIVRKNVIDPRTKISSLLKDKEQEWASVVEKKGPLRLLDLPMDVLKEIVKEVTHTNDLTALALTHSALHNLAIPHIYSRFDIVWPDAHATTDPRTGVDALTYGLATLCMGDVFTDHSQGQYFTCGNCGSQNIAECSHSLNFGSGAGQRRLGNQYPQFTRKFSLGNGPADWVQEYLITKESGKMLGTLVALAVARMVNLETFVWDMPTGVLRDVWLALSSLQNRHPHQECRLERVWVRWHDNSDAGNLPSGHASNSGASTTPQMLAGSTMTSVGWTIPPGALPSSQNLSQPLSYAQSRVEYPTLSVLPALRSLSVLDIDELDYLDEMSVLISKSKDRLRELRVGISAKAVKRDFAIAWDGPELQQVDHKAQWPGASTIGERRLGGVLGVLLGRVFDIRKKQKPKVEKKERSAVLPATAITIPEPQHGQVLSIVQHGTQNNDVLLNHIPEALENNSIDEEWAGKDSTTLSEAVLSSSSSPLDLSIGSATHDANGLDLNPPHLTASGAEFAQSDVDSLTALISAHEIGTATHHFAESQPEVVAEPPLRRSHTHSQRSSHFSEAKSTDRERLEGKLRLQTLELERIPLSVAVLQKAFDWSVLTNLTILDCAQHDRLWIMLRRHFQPSPLGPTHSTKHGANMQYHLNLRKVHTDAASPALISFLKETLAPNTLETLFLQDRKRSSTVAVTIDAIYRGPLKRHRSSLKRLMLDSSDRIPRSPTSATDSARWRSWMPNRDVLNFITSGRMSSLRELSIAIDYKDWHHFLQRLPQVPHLRSLNIPYIADHVTPAFDPRDLAMQVVDVIVLRPEVELCYMGISHKCFEILENRPHDESHGTTESHSSAMNGGAGGAVTDEEDEDEDEDGSDDDEDDEEEEDDNGTAMGAPAGIDPDETESELSDHDDSDTDSYDGSEDGRSKVKLRLREILFYDDKVAIFKARHGRL
ncbi:uncharacterized protein LY89DRAFT_574788 [Mollisia scopiformis]|uniref:F-box domain-containing protein n=1 Tax=Mollisia scopiformis TaxID=149040 RepID=A0A194XQW9_MOLSC|nr:uncharacterized protein LY89DRAFT_574788 [Mollisia scopiformis]KUJ22578.1 hypothetical protein LY89DRAFT_574788 [Mollisia scopiformis]